MIEVVIDSIRVNMLTYQRLVILKEPEKCPSCLVEVEKTVVGSRHGKQEEMWKCDKCGGLFAYSEVIRGPSLPIWIGRAEADAIALEQNNVKTPRPMTHDLLKSVIETLGANVIYIVVNDLKGDDFYAQVLLRFDGHDVPVDSRPSDAIALALRMKAPIFVDESVMDKAGVRIGNDVGKSSMEGSDKVIKETKRLTEKELKNLGPFKDFIDTMDWDDFDKKKS